MQLTDVVEKIICGTGHRPEKLKGKYSAETYMALVNMAMFMIEKMQPKKVISGAALGWDLAIADAACQMNVPFTFFIPCTDHYKIWRGNDMKRIYLELLDRSVDSQIICPGEYQARKMQTRNVAMVNASEVVVTLWNGERQGGTWNCIEYALIQRKPIVHMWKRWQDSYEPKEV